MIQQHRTHPQSGFTMIVISALFIAFAIMAAAIVERNTTLQQITRRDATAAQLSKLADAIIQYGVFHKSGTTLLYPCPAELNLAVSDPQFGSSKMTNGTTDCASTNPGPLPTGLSETGSSVLIGMVPVQTLSQYGIGINDAFDPWNNKIVYVVNREKTPTGGGAGTNPTIGEPWTSSYAIPAPDFILISLGKDGLGAYKREETGATPTIACPGGGANRTLNCDGNAAFYITPTYPSSDPATYFDDILTYFSQS